jgi:hypothetical protein
MAKQKKTEIVAKDPKHKRFYVFRHKMIDAESQVVENLKVGCFWGPAFEDAWLIADHATATELATQASKMLGGDDGFTYCVGAVDVIVDGFFTLEVIKK